VILGLDQGTSSTRCIAYDRELHELWSRSVPLECSFPRPGWVEQDPEALYESARRVLGDGIVGVANQTETFVVWERDSGRAVHPAIVWQDRRADVAPWREHAGLVRARTGLELDATFPAPKLAWLLDQGRRRAAEAGELAYGDVACWLRFRMTGEHVTDACNAGRTLLCPLGGTDWDDALLDLFGIPRALLPRIAGCDSLGDQQASLFGQRCWTPGAAKVTLGTGAFLLVNAGETAPEPPRGVLASCAWRREGVTTYALEGFVPTAGAAVDWFARLGAIPPAHELEPLLRAASPDDETLCVPTLAGTGVPSWNPEATGRLTGLRLGTTRADVARAVVDGVLHQVVDGLDAIGGVDMVRLDGGLSRSDWITQRLADLSGIRVERTARADATALGAALLAGLAAGVWDAPEDIPELPAGLVAEPGLSPAQRARHRERWAEASR
jgi:glycerol kinase